jgi:hypothetical protein
MYMNGIKESVVSAGVSTPKSSLGWLRATAIGAGLLCLSAFAQAQTVFFQESFNSGTGQFTGSGSVYTGSYGVRLRGGSSPGSIMSADISTVGLSNIVLSFDRTTSGLDVGEAAVALWSVDGSAFTAVESVRSASGRVSFLLGAAAANQNRLRLRFQINASSLLEYVSIDNITLSGNGSTNPPPGGGGTLPPVSSVDADGPFATTVTSSSGPGRGWVVRPTTLGANGLKHPIFIWGPGAGTGPSNYEFHLRRIASHGFVVYSETSTGDGDEMRAAITWLINENNRSGSTYYQKLDTTKIAIGGHSRGSLSAFGAASDARITTSIHVAGGSFDGNGSRNLRKPAAYICGEADTSATPNCERDYRNTTTPVWFTIMDGVSHTQAARSGLPAIVGWLRWHIGGETARRSMFIGTGCDFCSGMWDTQYKNW